MTDRDDLDPRIARSRAKILGAAKELLISRGVRGVTVDAVAESSGVAKSTLYRHWSSMDELLLDVFRSTVPPPVPVDPALGFEAGLRSWIAQAVTTLSAPDWARSLPVLLELRTSSPEMAALLAAEFDDKLASVATLLALGAAEGRIPSGLDAHVVTQMLAGPLVLAALSGDDSDLQHLADYVVERFLRSYDTSSR